jgi:tryptophan 2,3-dioxygenase
LWFKLVLHELTDARNRLLDGDPWVAWRRLRRCHEIERLLVDQVQLLETMTPTGFQEFRFALGRATGGQSAQYREIERLSGWPNQSSSEVLHEPDDRLPRRSQDQHTVWDGYLAFLADLGFDISTAESRRRAYAEVAAARPECGPAWAAHELTEILLDHDQAWSTWRARHALLVERQLGEGNGTGGSAGASYLWSGVRRRFYPELWAARNAIAARVDEQ